MSNIAAKSVTHHDDQRGGRVYPFLTGEWEIRSYAVTAELPTDSEPTLRWVKDDKVLDLHTPQTTADFLTQSGLQLHLDNGPYVLSKRLSRLMRPQRFYRFFEPNEIAIAHAGDELDADVWDGAALISRQLAQQLAANLDASHPNHKQHQHHLENTNRFEFTIMHAGGQEKGHALVVDDLALDILLPPNSTKREISLQDRVFVGLQPVRSHDDMRLDIQSLVNLYPFFKPEHLLAWLQMESELFLDTIRSGQHDQILSRLGCFQSEADLDQLNQWWLGEYLASGGSLMWFPGTIKAMGRQHQQRLESGEQKLRFPVVGGHYYLFPAVIGERDVPPGHVELDPDSATAWVNSEDWKDYIVNVLGGCDGDDAVWVVQFVDHDNEKKTLLWRSPNQLGEYVLLRPTERSHTIQWQTVFGLASYPRLDSRDLPPRIDSLAYQYGQLDSFPQSPAEPYTIAAMQPAIEQAKTNRGVLGAYCNMLLLSKALYGRLPQQLPARLEEVIDGSVKSARDLSPVSNWVNYAASRIVQQQKPIPASMLPRIEAGLNHKQKQQLVTSTDHWLDTLLTAVELHISSYNAEIDALTAEATPPAAVVEHGHQWLAQGTELRRLFREGVVASQTHPVDAPYLPSAQTAHDYLTSWGSDYARWVLLGSLTSAIGSGGSDTVAWQHETAPQTIAALRAIGLIGEPVWTRIGTLLWYNEDIPTVVPLQLNGVWLNWLKSQGHPFTSMSDVPKDLRDCAKAKIAELANEQFLGQILTTHVTDDDRITTYTTHGNLFGYVQRGQELTAVASQRWSIQSAIAKDGNLFTIVAAVQNSNER